MTNRIFLNVQDVHRFQEKMQQEFKNPIVKNWFEKKLRDFLMSEYKEVVVLTSDDVLAYYQGKLIPTIIENALENDEKIYNFSINARLSNELKQLKDFLEYLIGNQVDIGDIPFDVAFNSSQKWHKNLIKDTKKIDSYSLDGIKILKEFDDGNFLAKLITKKQFEHEGIISLYNKKNFIMSYRTAENKPLMTIEYTKSENGKDITILQAKFFGNLDYIDESHTVNILNYLYENHRKVNFNFAYPFGTFEKYSPILAFPEGYVFNQSMYITDCIGLPKGAIFNGNVTFERSRMPLLKDVTINGNVSFINSKTFAIDPNVTVTGKIESENSLLVGIPSHYKYKYTQTNN